MDKTYYGVTITRINTSDLRKSKHLARRLARNIRDWDRKECEYIGFPVVDSIHESIITSAVAYKAEYRGTLLCLFGVGPYKDNQGVIWALGSTELTNHKRALVKAGMEFIRSCLISYEAVLNYIAAGNSEALRFIRRAGAECGTHVTINGHEFVRFIISRR